VLDFVQLRDERKNRVSQLSKGMKQRVTLARALLHEPSLLFLDKPTSSIGPINTKHIYEGLKWLNERGTTIFLTTHDMYEAELLCDRIAFLHGGKRQLLDSPENLKLQFADDTITVRLKNGKTILLKK